MQRSNRCGELIVRHLLMPGHVDCCWAPIAAWLAQELPGVQASLRTEFWPAGRSPDHPELQNAVSAEERRKARAIARDHDLNLID